MDWNTLKANVYCEDGSLLDIYVLHTSAEDWRKWIELVNGKYKVSFYNGQTGQTTDKIDFEAVQAHWTRKTDFTNGAIITIGNFTVNCHFFGADEIENDVCPREIQSPDNHHQLMEYLTNISNQLDKKVILTTENSQESVLIKVEGERINLIAG
jgi:predicted RNA-binding protein Jag